MRENPRFRNDPKGGPNIQFSEEEELVRDAEEKASRDAKPMKDWTAEMEAMDVKMSREGEDYIETMDADQLSKLSPFRKNLYDRKKAKRAQRPT